MSTSELDRIDEERRLAEERRRQEEALPVAPPEHLWLHDRDAAGERPDAHQQMHAEQELAADTDAGTRPGQRLSHPSKRKLRMRALLVASLCGVGMLGYLQMAPKTAPAVDLLGSSLPSGNDLPDPTPTELDPEVDPRLGGPDAPAARSLPSAINLGHPSVSKAAETGATSAKPTVSMAENAPIAAPSEEAAKGPSVATAPTSTPTLKSLPAETVTTADLQEQLRTTQALVAALTKQLAELQKAQDARVPARPAAQAVVTPPSPAAVPQAVAAATPPPRPVAQPRQSTPRAPRAGGRAPAARTAVAAAPQQPATTTAPAKPAAPLGGQLVAVDMWNGEPSVVVASGLPGDRRLRVLRPGDVVNGLALKSADPVSKSATFASPGSAGLTLYVSQGG